MAGKREKEERSERRPRAIVDEPATASPPAAPAAPEPASVDRITIAITPEGSIAWDRMRPSTQETVRRLIGASAPGGAAPSGVSQFDPLIVNALYDAVGLLAANIARATHHTVDSSRKMLFTDDEKAAFLAPTQRVLDKYGSALTKWQDEIMLAMLVGVTLQNKIAQLEREPADIVKFPQRTNPEPQPGA